MLSEVKGLPLGVSFRQAKWFKTWFKVLTFSHGAALAEETASVLLKDPELAYPSLRIFSSPDASYQMHSWGKYTLRSDHAKQPQLRLPL